MQQKGHGAYEDVAEGDFLELVTKTPLVVAHFYHRDFERCRILDTHLGELARTHFDTRFIKVSAPVSHRRLAGVVNLVHEQMNITPPGTADDTPMRKKKQEGYVLKLNAVLKISPEPHFWPLTVGCPFLCGEAQCPDAALRAVLRRWRGRGSCGGFRRAGRER